MSQDTLSVHAPDTSPFAANLEERQALSQVATISFNHEVAGMSQDTPSVHAADTSPFSANQDLEERQAPSQAAMISSNYAKISNSTFYNVLGSVHHNSSHNRSGP